MTPKERLGILLFKVQDAREWAMRSVRALEDTIDIVNCIREAEERPAAITGSCSVTAQPAPKASFIRGSGDQEQEEDSPPAIEAGTPRNLIQAIELLDEWLADKSGYDELAWPQIKESLTGQPTPSSIEVEMRVIVPPWPGAGWTWCSRLGGVRLDGSQGWPTKYFEKQEQAEAHGNTWLAALSQQLGVKLVAKWEDDLTT